MFQPILMRFLCADVREKDLQSCHPERSRRRSEGSGANKRLEATDSSLTLRMTERTLRMTGPRGACALVKEKAEMCADEMPPRATSTFSVKDSAKTLSVCLPRLNPEGITNI